MRDKVLIIKLHIMAIPSVQIFSIFASSALQQGLLIVLDDELTQWSHKHPFSKELVITHM